MGLFSRRTKDSADKSAPEAAAKDSAVASADPDESTTSAGASSAAPFSREAGPFDVDEKSGKDTHIDFGGLRLQAAEGTQIRLDVDQSTDSIVAVTVDQGSSSLQIQAFAAPKSRGLWDEIRQQIRDSVSAQGGSSEVIDGELGQELFVKIPVTGQDGSMGYRSARFLGVDGPRWFIRGVLGGPAATDEREASGLVELFRNTIVVRGDHPMPPKELLALKVPAGAKTE